LTALISDAYVRFAKGRPEAEATPTNGGPPWLRSALYDIDATAEGAPSVGMMMGPMLQVLLEERFRLKVHWETSEGTVYFLNVARGGSKLRASTEDSCTPYTFPAPPLKAGQKICGSNIRLTPGADGAARPRAAVESLGATLDEFCKLLTNIVGRQVINKTGITGRLDIRFDFSGEEPELDTVPANGPRSSDPAAAPAIFTAIQEQLGLRLDAGKGPIEVLVIDQIERPSEN
jgi:uncharacterized protein (TIGR03435 family)